MPIKQQITDDMKVAMKAHEAELLGTLRMVSSVIQNETINKKAKGEGDELNDEEVLAVLKREAKKRKESILMYEGAGRTDLSDTEKKELEIIRKYLPEEMSREQIELIAKEVIDSGVTEFPKAMKETMAKAGPTADGKVVAEVIKLLLG